MAEINYSVIEANLLVICCCFISIKSFLRHYAPRLIGEGSTYLGTDSLDTPRKKALVIKKDVSFNLSWHDENTPRGHLNAGYVEMDDMKQGPGSRKPTSESQEVIIQPTIEAPAPVRKF